ncbi:MAG TPA: hypothetical protein VF595_06410 [Tepidisphaeraceae bacterium]|jgi:hypothetical protein
MQIAGNVLILFLIPISVVAAMSLRASFNVAGSDAVGPLFLMVIAVALRWILLALLIGFCVARGGFNGLVPFALLQWLVVAALFFALDAATCMAITAVSRSGAQISPGAEAVAIAFAYLLTLLSVLLLLFPLNAPATFSSGTIRAVIGILFTLSAVVYAAFYGMDQTTIARTWQKFEADQAKQADLARPYAEEVAAIPANAPVDRYASFFTDPDCPESVRSVIAQRMMRLPDLDRQLLNMLTDDRRELAMTVYSRTSRLHEPAHVAALFESSRQLADHYRERLSTPDEATGIACARAAALTIYFTHGQSASGVNFRPTVDAWKAALDRVHSADATVANAKHEVDQWLALNHPVPARNID